MNFQVNFYCAILFNARNEVIIRLILAILISRGKIFLLHIKLFYDNPLTYRISVVRKRFLQID